MFACKIINFRVSRTNDTGASFTTIHVIQQNISHKKLAVISQNDSVSVLGFVNLY